MSAKSMIDKKELEANNNFIAKGYWKKRLAGFEFENYFDGNKTRTDNSNNKYDDLTVDIATEIDERVTKIAASDKAKHLLLLSVVSVLVQKYSSIRDLIVFSPIYKELRENTGNKVLPIRIDNFSNVAFTEFLTSVKDIFIEDIKHANYSLEKILNISRNEIKELSSIAIGVNEIHEIQDLENLNPDMLFSFGLNPTLTLQIKYDNNKFDQTYIKRIGDHYIGLLGLLLDNKDQLVDQIELIDENEKSLILDKFNRTKTSFPSDKTIIDLFIEQVAKTPDALAVKFNDETLTYIELDQRSNQVAHYIVESEVPKGTPIGVLLDRSLELMVAIYGILKAGCVYMPLTASHPKERILYALRNSACGILITDKEHSESFEPEFKCVAISDLTKFSEDNVNLSSPTDAAYIIYTSGSTGNPKGVLIQHMSVINRLNWMQKKYRLSAKDVILHKTPIVFDVSVWELFWWSFTGASVVLAQPGAEKEPNEISKIIDKEGITVLHFVPSMLSAFLNYYDSGNNSYSLKSIKHLFSSGEELLVTDAKSFLAACPNARLHNLYGPTEATVDVSFYEVTPQLDSNRIPIGKPIDNTQLLIFSEDGHLQPIGIPGELFIGGVNLAVGYVNQEELTNEKFVVSPIDKKSRLYKTGDLARWRSDGNIEYLGRIDNQVKIRGNRIEIAEIESVMESFTSVSKAIVLPKESKVGTQLVGYVVEKPDYSEEMLREYLATKLPEYMLPAYFIQIDEVPITINGKVDRKKLLDLKKPIATDYTPPRTELERLLTDQWGKILENERIGINDNFFRIGGDSILAVRLIGAINSELSMDLSMANLLENETITELANCIEILKSQGTASAHSHIIKEVEEFNLNYLSNSDDDSIEVVYPMSDIEKGMCFQSLKNPDDIIYFEQNFTPIQYKDFDLDILKSAIDLLVQKHPILRTGYDLSSFAHIVYKNPEQDIKYTDLLAYDRDEQERIISSDLEESREKRFDMSTAPLWRMNIYMLEKDYHLMVFELHHAIMDGWSYSSFLIELNNTYAQLIDNKSFKPDLLVASYKDYIVQELYQKQNEETLEFWKNELDDYKKLDLGITNNKKEYKTVEKDYSLDLLSRLESVASEKGTSVKHLLFAAYLYALKMLTYEDDIVVGLVGFNRPLQKDGDRLLGCFLNTVPVRIKIPQDITWDQYIDLVHDKLVDVRKYDALSLFEINQAIRGESLDDNPFFNTIFNFVNFHIFNELKQQEGTESVEDKPEFDNFLRGDTLFDVVMEVNENALNARYHFVSSFIDEEKFGKFLNYYEKVIAIITENRNEKVNTLAVIDEEEKKRLLIDFNSTKKEFSHDETIVSLFETQVKKSPDKIAIVHQNKSLTYKELNIKVNQLANRLRDEYKVLPNELIGIMTNRSESMIIGLLGILKSGAAYVPIDPTYPAERIKYIIQDSNVKLLLTNDEQDELPKSFGIDVLDLGDSEAFFKSNANDDLKYVNTSQDLCYVIYTSGSTGKPKGVMISHKNVVNFFGGMSDQIKVDENDSLLALTSISFDISVLEIFWTLCNGVEVVIHPLSTSLNNMDRYVSEKQEPLDFSVFFFSSYDDKKVKGKYDLLLNTVKYADKEGFKAVWTPERHFHEFGGLFPNPSVTSSALAMITDQIELRCGSIVSPLHDEIRIAEEWSVVDNLSDGRVSLSFASGWNPNDFSLKSGGDYKDRQKTMYDQIEVVRKLWRGDKIKRTNGLGKEIDVSIFPTPIQNELPIWVTAASSDETFKSAGAVGANLLTHLLGQDTEELSRKIALYRNERKSHGHAGEGKVALMLHTYVGDNPEDVKSVAEKPFIEYIKSSLGLTKSLYQEAGYEDDISDEAKETVLKSAFDRYHKTSTLIGTIDECREMLKKLRAVGVNEIACLVDFGIQESKILSGLKNLKELKEQFSVEEKTLHKPVTIMQSTPSFVRLVEESSGSQKFLQSLSQMMLGGEALPLSVIKQIREKYNTEVYNMYGPTETTVWSCMHKFNKEVDSVSIGKPIINTQVYILDKALQLLPEGVAGDLYIGGQGLSKGYLNRPDLTEQRFVNNSFIAGEKIYNTGDIARWLPNGNLEFVGRRDYQVKIRGHRIELGEIENHLTNHKSINESVVIINERQDDKFLVAYYGADNDIEVGELRSYMADTLPEYMIPSHFVRMDRLPLTPNGKLNRKALPDLTFEVSNEYVAPSGEMEIKLASIWAEVLKMDQSVIGVNTIFFEIGGHSLTGVLLSNRISKSFGIDFPLQEVYAKPTIKQMAGYLEIHLWLTKEPKKEKNKKTEITI